MVSSPRAETLSSGAVHVWHIYGGVHEDVVLRCRRVLSVDEAQRADRFHFDRDRNLFICFRAALRSILARYLNVAPNRIAFSYAAQGKPDLAPGSPESRLRFNLSHSHDRCLLAVTLDAQVGIDIEFIDRGFTTDEIAERFFSCGEVKTLQALSPEERPAAFFSCWTRKEAYIKAVGEGLSLPLDSFDVAFGPGVPPALLRVQSSPHEVSRWSMYNLPAPPGYAAAMVIEGSGHSLQERAWDWRL